MKVLVTLEGNEKCVADIDARDRRAFEVTGRREFGLPPGMNMQDAVKAIPESYIGWLSWHALIRTKVGDIPKDWRSFESRLIATESMEVEEEAFGFPTQLAT